MAVTSTPSFGIVYDDDGNELVNQFYSPSNPSDQTVLTGSSFDTKIGYKFRAAAQRELFVILQDIEGLPLTDSSGEPLVSLIDGFVTSELTSDKALGVVLPTIPKEQQVFDFTLFGQSFDLRRRQIGAAPGGGDILPYIEITNPQDGFKYIGVKDTIEISSGPIINRDIPYRSTEFVPGGNYEFGQMVYVVNGSTVRLYDTITAGELGDSQQYPATTTAPTHTSGIVNNGQVQFRFVSNGVIDPDLSDSILVTANDGREVERFIIESIEQTNVSNNVIIRYILNKNPENEIRFDDVNPVSLITKRLTITRVGTVKVEEVFPSVSEVSSSLLGIPRAETQLGLFSNVSTYGFDEDSFVYFTDNNSIGPAVWTQRETEREGPHYQSRVEEVGNEGALRISSFPVPYTFPYPPLAASGSGADDNLGLFNLTSWERWQNWLSLGKALYEYAEVLRDNASSSEDKRKYTVLMSRFLPAINIWDDSTFYGDQFFGNSTTTYYKQISIWTDTWNNLNSGILLNPVTGVKINFEFLTSQSFQLRGTGTDIRLNAGSIPSGTPNEGADPAIPATYLNPFKEEWLNRLWISADQTGGGIPASVNFKPGYSEVGGQYALLQSRQAFRYQPGRISGYTFGTRATMSSGTLNNYAEWGIFNDFDEYVFRRDADQFFIVRRSNVHLPISVRQELGVTDIDGNDVTENIRYYDKIIAGKTYNIQEIVLNKERFNGDSLDGNGPSGYLLTTNEITMYKIEFGWYGAIGLRMFAYIPIESGKARWVVVHTFVIENKLSEPSMGDPFYRFKYEMRIGSQQAPRLTEPQILYKYGTSMYIDGGDEGTVSVFSQTSDAKTLPFQVGGGNYVSLFGIYPKTNIVSGGTDAQGNPVEIPNKKIIIPKSMSITATAVNPGETNAMAEINFTKCTACTGSGFLYMPNIANGYSNTSRKFVKLPTTGFSDKLTLAPIDIVLDNVDRENEFVTSDPNLSYIRNGDYIDSIVNGSNVSLVNSGHIVDMKYRGVTGTVTNGGSAYVSGSYNNIPLSGGTGTDITADIIIVGGIIESVVPTNKGQNYTVGDVLSIDPADMYGEQVPGQGIPGTGMQFTVTGVDTFSFKTVSLVDETIINSVSSDLVGSTITVQPCFILNEGNRQYYDVPHSDYKCKVITTRMWNTYIGNTGSIQAGNLPTTVGILGYIPAERWKLEEVRKLDPAKIVTNPSSLIGGVPPTPADFFGDPTTETFDAKLDHKSTIVASPQPLSGPTGVVKWLQNYFKDGTGNTREWEIGFTPYRPVFDEVTGELTKWITPPGQDYTKVCYQYNESTGNYESYDKLQIDLSDDRTVSLDLHPYSTSVTYTGFENGENWYGRIAPFTEDFRIGTPKGTSSGRCAQARLRKQNTTAVEVEQITSADLDTDGILVSNFLVGSFVDDAEYQSYKNLSANFLRTSGGVNIYKGTGDPTGGQIAFNPTNTESYIKFFYTSDGSGGVTGDPQIVRFAGKEKVYQIVDPATGLSTSFNIIPIVDDVGADVDIKSAVDANGALLIPASDPDFKIAYNGVEMISWFSGGYSNSDADGRYNVPDSYTGGGNNQGVFNFDAFPMYAFFKFRDGAEIRGAELHDIDELNNLSTQNPQWKRNFDTVINKATGIESTVDRCTYGLPNSLETGQLNVNGVGGINQTSLIPDDDVVPSAFQQVSRLSSANIDTQGESILRPGSRMTTLYINNETKYFDLEDVFGFDRKVLTPDVVNTEAIYIVGKAIGNTSVDIEINITYIEQL